MAQHRWVSLIALVALSAVLAGCSPSPSATNGSSTGTGAGSSAGEALVAEKCSQCHSLDRVDTAVKDASGWNRTVDRMESNGLKVTDSERAQIIAFLARRDSSR